MKKKALIICIFFFLVIAVIVCYVVFDVIFPKAQPVSCPTADEIFSVSVSRNNEDKFVIGEEQIKELLQKISQAKPTRKMSINDYPAAETYYEVEVSASRMYCYFIYEENSQVYVELPYEGIYKSDYNMLSFFAQED